MTVFSKFDHNGLTILAFSPILHREDIANEDSNRAEQLCNLSSIKKLVEHLTCFSCQVYIYIHSTIIN